MISESWLTYEETAQVADNLWRHKKAVSAQTIYDALGGRGSKATIQKHLHRWRSILDELPTPSDPVLQAVKQVWDQLQSETKAQLLEEEKNYQSKLQEAQKAQQAAERENNLNQEALQITQTELTKVVEQAKLFQANLTQEKTTRHLTEERLQSAEQRLKDKERFYDQQLQSLRTEHDKTVALLKEQIVSQQKTIHEMKEQSEQQRHKYLTELDSLRITNHKLDQQLIKIQLLEQQAQEQNRKLHSENDQCAATLHQLMQEKEKLVEELQGTNQNLAVTRKELEHVKKQADDYFQQHQETLQQLMQSQQQAVLMEERFKRAETEWHALKALLPKKEMQKEKS